MSRALQTTCTQTASAPIEAEEIVWPEFNPSPGYCHFIERLNRARIERGLSIADMAGEVGLTFRLANEFENGVTPLPFCHLELWCEAVGVPFDDYLALYRAEERAWDEREAEKKAPCITDTEATETEAPAPALSRSPSSFGFLNSLRSAFAHIRDRFLSLFSTPEQKPK